jgi:hypothetical protein
MRKSVFFAAATLAVTVVSAAAQTPAASSLQDPRWFASLNGGVQTGSQDLTRSVTFGLYDETATVGTEQSIENGGFIDISGAARLYEQYGVGLAYNSLSKSNPGTFSASLPHPVFFDQPRTLTGSATLEHEEKAVHVSAMWFMQYTDKIDFAFGIGPSFFTVRQGFIRGISFTENVTSVTLNAVDAPTLKESGVGFHLSGDVTYAVTRNIGAGVLLRYTRGGVTFDIADGESVDVDAGGFQIGGGIRLRF